MCPSVSIEVQIHAQKLLLLCGSTTQCFSISTSLRGIGQAVNSFKTPLGEHFIAEKSGENAPIGTVFRNRQPISMFNAKVHDENQDWILTRVLRLAGLEENFNHGEGCDTFARMIYIHGTPDYNEMGLPGSKGCIRMRNIDIIQLFDQVSIGCKVRIYE